MSFAFHHAKQELLEGTLDLGADVLKVMLVSAAYAASAADGFVASAAAAELAGDGYVGGFSGTGRRTVTGKAFLEVGGSVRLTADDLRWTAIKAGTAAGAILYRQGTTDADSPLIAFFDSGFPFVTNGGNLLLRWDPSGFLLLS